MLAKYNLYTGYIIDRVPKENASSCLDIVNPNTGNKLLIIGLLIITSLGIYTFIYKKKVSRYKD